VVEGNPDGISHYTSFYDVKAEALMRERAKLSAEIEKLRMEYQTKIDKLNEKINPFYIRVSADE
jgi:hypothetical protein